MNVVLKKSTYGNTDETMHDQSLVASESSVINDPQVFVRSVAETAYFQALAHGFPGGHELEDWLGADEEFGVDSV